MLIKKNENCTIWSIKQSQDKKIIEDDLRCPH